MNQRVTTGIVLARTNYGEADRIITVITPDEGKLRLVARGVRKPKSKLAGGIELFSISSLTYIRGRGELGTLISARLEQHYGAITKRLERVQLGYELLKMLDRATEDEPEADYFVLLQGALEALNDPLVSPELIRFWFLAGLIKLAGHMPNLQTDDQGQKLLPDRPYTFNFESVAMSEHPRGTFAADQIKFLRLVFAGNSPKALQQINDAAGLVQATAPLIQTMLTSYIRV